MTRVLIVWEDEYWQALDAVVRRALDTNKKSEESAPSVLGVTSRGNGNFQHFVESTWPNVRPKGTPSNRGSIDHLVCVIDGDKLHEIVATASPITAVSDEVAKVQEWQRDAAVQWNSQLRAWAPKSVDPSTVHGVVLSWSKESLLLAGFDREAFERVWAVDNSTTEHRAFIESCNPRPDVTKAEDFTARYRKPRKCLDQLLATHGTSLPSKSDPRIDDALKGLAREATSALYDRVESLRTLTELLWRLHRAEPETAPTPLVTTTTKKNRKPSR